ncbi:MAG: hypothetical protein LBG72_00025 [Spirochaetaceae bacterium]|jgi:hypothetical protein|nr:hypothetical protein [Spirochaetaceae bacterium]
MGLGDLAGKAGGIAALPGRLLKKLFAKPLVRICVLIFAGICIIVPIITAFFVISAKEARKKSELPAPDIPRGIDADSIFLPEEPDFLPQAILLREPSPVWTEEETRRYWTDPADAAEGFWLKNIEKTIDTLLEKVR